jgi:hypothetical protein
MNHIDGTSSGRVIAASFDSRSEAEAAVRELRVAGFPDNRIGLMSLDKNARIGQTHRPDQKSGLPNDPTESRWEEGTGVGAAAGAVTGTGLGLAVAAGLIPAIGPLIAGGTLVALLASAGAGATVGTLVGGLIGLGIPEEEATYYEDEIKSGRVLVTVQVTDDTFGKSADVQEILARHSGRFRQPAGVGGY